MVKISKICKAIKVDSREDAYFLLKRGLKKRNISLIDYGISLDWRLLDIAIDEDLCQTVTKLMRLGANPDRIKGWEKDASFNMRQIIRNNM